ncbi:MAG: hypothetical protein ACFFDT_25350, partial [Candidatus Hodarchaeota archaeon]
MGTTRTRDKIIQKIQKLQDSPEYIDQTLDIELTQLLTSLTDSRYDDTSDETMASLEQIELLVDQLSVRIQRRKSVKQDKSVTTKNIHSSETRPIPPLVTFLISLKLCGHSEAQHVAEELERIHSVLSDLMDPNFRGGSEARIRNQAQKLHHELTGITKGELAGYWISLLDFGVDQFIESIQQDRSGKNLLTQIQDGIIDLDEIVETVKRLVNRTESIASQRILIDLERSLNEGELEYIIPRMKRTPNDPFIVRLSNYINPHAIINSRFVTPFEKIMREKSLHRMKEILYTIDEIENVVAQIKDQDAGGLIELRMKKVHDTLDLIFQNTDTIQVVDFQDEVETETAYLCLLLRSYAFDELKDRLLFFYSKLLEEAPTKFLISFFNRKIIRYVQEIHEYTNPKNARELQAGIQDLRNAAKMVESRFSLEDEKTDFIEVLTEIMAIFIEELQPDYPLLFERGDPKVLKDFLGFDKLLKKAAKKIRKILSKEETPENAWRKLQAQLD